MSFLVNIHAKVVTAGITAADVAAADFKLNRVKEELSRQRDAEPRAAFAHSEKPFVPTYAPYTEGAQSIEALTKAMLAQEKK